MQFKFETEDHLTYSVPTAEETEKMYEQLRSICIAQAERLHPYDKWVHNRALTELDFLRMGRQIAPAMILREIAAFSKACGYPVMMPGMESRMVVFELLGVTNLYPTEMGYYGQRHNMVFTALFRKEPAFEVFVAAQIKDKLTDSLNETFGAVGSSNKCDHLMIVQDYTALDVLGELAKATGVPYGTIEIDVADLGDPALLQPLTDDLIKREFGWEPGTISCDFLSEAARLYAFARCNVSGERTPELLQKVKEYVFRDDIYGKLTHHGIPAPIALHLSRNWAKGTEKERNMDLMQRIGLAEDVLDAYGVLSNQWAEASCLARIRLFVTLKFYELHFPKQYAAILARFDAQEEEIL